MPEPAGDTMGTLGDIDRSRATPSPSRLRNRLSVEADPVRWWAACRRGGGACGPHPSCRRLEVEVPPLLPAEPRSTRL